MKLDLTMKGKSIRAFDLMFSSNVICRMFVYTIFETLMLPASDIYDEPFNYLFSKAILLFPPYI